MNYKTWIENIMADEESQEENYFVSIGGEDFCGGVMLNDDGLWVVDAFEIENSKPVKNLPRTNGEDKNGAKAIIEKFFSEAEKTGTVACYDSTEDYLEKTQKRT